MELDANMRVKPNSVVIADTSTYENRFTESTDKSTQSETTADGRWPQIIRVKPRIDVGIEMEDWDEG